MLCRLGLSLAVVFGLCAIASSSALADQSTWSDLSQDQKNVIANAALTLSGREPTYADPGGQGRHSPITSSILGRLRAISPTLTVWPRESLA
jgi:hypothetical protein